MPPSGASPIPPESRSGRACECRHHRHVTAAGTVERSIGWRFEFDLPVRKGGPKPRWIRGESTGCHSASVQGVGSLALLNTFTSVPGNRQATIPGWALRSNSMAKNRTFTFHRFFHGFLARDGDYTRHDRPHQHNVSGERGGQYNRRAIVRRQVLIFVDADGATP